MPYDILRREADHESHRGFILNPSEVLVIRSRNMFFVYGIQGRGQSVKLVGRLTFAFHGCC